MNVLRKFVDANNAPLSGRKVLFTPIKSPEISASWLSTADSYQFVTDESGEITASVVANKYRVEIGNPLPATHFYLEVSETGSAVISSSVAGVPQRVYGNLFNLIKDPTKVKKFTITPARNYPQYVDNTIVALCHTASVPTDQGAVDYVSLYPGVYQCDALGKVNTIFHISVPAEGTSLEWNLKDLLVVKPSKGTPVKLFEGDNSYVLTVSSSDARYKKKSETGGDVELADTASYVKGTNVDGAVESASTASYIEGFNVRGQVNSAQMADRAGYAVSLNDETGPLTITSDYTKWTANGPFVATAMTASNGFYGTASHATSASYAPKPTKVDSASLSDTASYVKASNVDGTVTSASYAISSSHAPKPDKVNSASLADSASYVKASNVDGTVTSASYALSASHSPIPDKVNSASLADSASYVKASNVDGTVTSASYALSASHAPKPDKVNSASLSDSASYVKASNVDGTVTSASYAVSSSYAPRPDKVNSASMADSASYVKASNVDGTVTSASYAQSASRALTASALVPNNVYTASKISLGTGVVIEDYDLAGGQLGVPGLKVGDDKATIWSSGQAKFKGITSSLHGTASHALSASYAPGGGNGESASYADRAESASYATSASWAPTGGPSESASYASTASFAYSASNLTPNATIAPLGVDDGGTLYFSRGANQDGVFFRGGDYGLLIESENNANYDLAIEANVVPIGTKTIGAALTKWDKVYANNFVGTASWATQSLTASYLPNAKYTITASRADTASYLVPANNYSASKIHLGSGVVIEDYDLAGGQLGVPGLHVGTANLNVNDKATIWSSGQADFIGVTSSLHGTASWAKSASYSISASYASASYSAAYAMWSVSASWASASVSAAYALYASHSYTSSYLTPENEYSVKKLNIGNIPLTDIGGIYLGAPGVMTDTIELLSGNTLMNTFGIFTNNVESPKITGSLFGTSSWAHSASFARTASYLPKATYEVTSSWAKTATSASVLSTARSIALSGYAVGTATNFNGSANISIPVTSLKAEGIVEPDYVRTSVTNTFRPNVDVVRADRTVFLPAEQIIIEQSIDTGTTWTDAGVSDTDKRKLFIGDRPTISLPLSASRRSSKCMLRITFTGMKYNVPGATPETDKYGYWNNAYVQSNERYSMIDSGWMWINSIGDRIYYTVEAAKGNDANTWTKMGEGYADGASGMGSFKCTAATFGGEKTQVTNHWNWRFTFRTAAPDSTFDDGKIGITSPSTGQRIHHIKMFGDRVFTPSNRLMYNDHIYKWDIDQNVEFPAQVSASRTVSPVVTLTDGANIATPCEKGSHFRVTLGGNRTLSNPSNAADGQRLVYQVKQDATGGRTLTFGNKFKFGEDIPNITLSTGPGQVDFIGVLCDTVNDAYYVVSFNKGF